MLNSDSAAYGGGYYVARENQSHGTLVRGVDFTETLSVNKNTFPNGTVISWNWPGGGWAQAPSFPEIAFGNLHSQNLSPAAAQVNTFTNLSTKIGYSYAGPDFTFNPLMEMWLSSDSAWTSSLFEVELQLDQSVKQGNPYNNPINHHMSSPFDADIILAPGGGGAWTQVLIFPQITPGSNTLTNTTLSGSSDGTPGTDPTNADFTQGNLGLTKTIVGSGSTTAIDGTTIHYVDVRYHGTTTGAGNMQAQILSESHMPDAAPGDKWYGKIYLAVTAGATTNLDDIEVQIKSYDSGFGQLQADGGGNILAALTSTPQPFGVATTLVASAAFSQGPIVLIHAAAGSLAVDITLRIGTPTFCTGGFKAINNTTVDWKAIYADLIAAGVITGDEYAHGFEIGAEVYSGVGSMTINTFAVDWTV